jgi:hypothetical protein
VKRVLLIFLIFSSHNVFCQSDTAYYKVVSNAYCACSTTLDKISKMNLVEVNDNCYEHILNRFISDSGMEPLYKEYPQVSKNVLDSIFRETMSDLLMSKISPYLNLNCTFFNKERMIDSLLVDKTNKKEIKRSIRQYKKELKSEKNPQKKSSYLVFIGILSELNQNDKKALHYYNKSLAYQKTKFAIELKEEVLNRLK